MRKGAELNEDFTIKDTFPWLEGCSSFIARLLSAGAILHRASHLCESAPAGMGC